jgi:hypothetical protein
MALDFPSSPTLGQSYPAPPVAGVPLYVFDGVAWSTQGTYIDSKVTGPANATDTAIARFDQTTGKLIKNSLILLDDTGRLSDPPFGVPIIGRTNGVKPAAGEIGEIISNLVPLASGVAAVSGSAGQTWNTINLTPGAWLCGCLTGVFGNSGAGTTVFTHMHASYGLGITSINTAPGIGDTIAMHITSNHSNGWLYGHSCVPYYLPSGGTINANATTDFTGGTAVFYGNLWGIRIA